MDNYFFTISSTCQNHTHMPWRSIQSSQATNTHSYTQIKVSMQYHIAAFPPASMIWNTFSLNTANLNIVNISTPEFRIWKHLEDDWNSSSLQHLARIPSVPLDDLYKQMITSNGPMNQFTSTDESTGETISVWTLFSHTEIYITAIGLLIPTGLGMLCCYLFCCQPARLACWPLQSGSTWCIIVNDNVEAAPIYRCNGKAGQPIVRPHENHELHIEWEPTQMESWQKQQISSRAVPT